jgi:hypothetical protein
MGRKETIHRMVSATTEIKPHISHSFAKNGWNLCRISGLHSLCMMYVRRMSDNLTAYMNQEQDENDSRYHAMDVVELEENHVTTKRRRIR